MERWGARGKRVEVEVKGGGWRGERVGGGVKGWRGRGEREEGGGGGEVGERDETERDGDEDEDENVDASEDAAERFCNTDTDTAALRSTRRRGARTFRRGPQKKSGRERHW